MIMKVVGYGKIEEFLKRVGKAREVAEIRTKIRVVDEVLLDL